MRRYVNSILLLRFLNLSLLLLLLFQFGTLLDQFAHWRQFFTDYFALQNGQVVDNIGPNHSVSAHPLHNPLPACSLRLEAIRLNELFARPQHKCGDRRVVGGHRDSFFVCFDAKLQSKRGMFGDTLLVSGAKEGPAGSNFERDLNVSVWSLVLPGRNKLVESLQTDVILQFMPELEEYGQFPRDRIANMLAGQSFDLAKLDLDTEMLAKGQRSTEGRIELIEWILKGLTTKQLLLTFRPGLDGKMGVEDEEKKGSVLLAWYLFMYKLYFRWNFALLGVRSNGRCGQAMQIYDGRHCEWRASFVHFDDSWEATNLPAYGIGSPFEEKLRFIRFLLAENGQSPSQCSEGNNDKLPLAICQDGRQFDLLVYFRYSPVAEAEDGQFESLLAMTDKMALSCPANYLRDKKWIDGNLKIGHIDAGISHSANQSMSMPLSGKTFPTIFWPLRPFDALLASIQLKTYQRNLLLFDLDGAELDVLPVVVEKAICEKWLRSFQQIALRIRVWAMEESENWRRFYLLLLRLEECQFGKAFSRQLNKSTFLVTYKRIQIVGGK